MKPVYLYGFMGCGKSYIGRKSAFEAGLCFVDLDMYITEREGVQISAIFASGGEEHFRRVESSALSEVSADVISLGGGTLTNPDAAAYAKENAVVIFIDTPFETCYERIKNDKNRPNAVNKSKDELLALYQAREKHYREAADYTLETPDEIINLIRELCGNTGDLHENL
jgi:shikimate kinase